MFTLQPGVGWVGGSAFITGWILIVVLAAIVGPSVICLRKRGYFQVGDPLLAQVNLVYV